MSLLDREKIDRRLTTVTKGGRRGRINTLTSENKEMRNVIEKLSNENRHLKQLEIRQSKALDKFEKSQYSLPGIVHHHQKTVEGMKEQIKKYQTLAEKHQRRSVQLEEELNKSLADNETLKKLSKGNVSDLKEVEVLKRRNDELKQKAAESEKEVDNLKRHIDNLTKNHRREIVCLKKKSKETLSTVVSLQQKCKEKNKLLEIRDKEAELANIYALRQQEKKVKADKLNEKSNKSKEETASTNGDEGEEVQSPQENINENQINNNNEVNPTESSTSLFKASNEAAALRRKSYEVRMSRIREKNKEKMAELRVKLEPKTNDMFKFPYDTLKRRNKEAIEKVSPRENELEPEIAAICDQEEDRAVFQRLDTLEKRWGGVKTKLKKNDKNNRQEEEQEEEQAEHEEETPIHVINYVMSCDNNEDNRENLDNDERASEHREDRAKDEEIEMQEDEGRKCLRVNKATSENQNGDGDGFQGREMVEGREAEITRAREEIESKRSLWFETIEKEMRRRKDIMEEDGVTVPNGYAIGGGDEAKRTVSSSSHGSTKSRRENHEKRPLNFFESQWVIQEEDEDENN